MGTNRQDPGPRSDWPVEVHTIRTQAPATVRGSAFARLQALDELSHQTWKLTGRPLPEYERSAMPVRMITSLEGDPAGP